MTSLFGVTAGVDALLGILGRTSLLIDGEVDESWGKPRERAVLATLAVHVNRVVRIDTLIRWAWPADTPEPRNPAETFHTYAARIRRALRRLPAPANLRAGEGGYRLEMDRANIDHSRFRELVAQARALAAARQPEPAVGLLDRALALFRGSPLADLSSPAAEAWRAGVVQNELLPANTTLIEQLMSTRRFGEALVRLDDLHADHPDDVTLASLRMTALYGERRGTHATAFYFAMRRKLKNNGEDLAAEHLRRHYDTLSAEHSEAHRPAPALTPHQLPPANTRFVGRGETLGLLDAAANLAGGPKGVVVIDGPGGVGKTALAVEWAHRRRELFPGGDLFVNMHGYANRAQIDHGTVVDEFLMALGQRPDPSLPPRARDQLLSSLLAARRTLVVLDNVRDSSHVRDLVPLLPNSLVLITSRQWLTALHAETGAERITVPPMSPHESVELLSAQLGPRSDLGEAHRAGLAELCGGLPLLLTVLGGDLARKPATGLTEYVTLLDRRQLVVATGHHGDGPTSGAACFDLSYQALTPGERRLFRLLTTHPGPEFGIDAACACGGRPPEETTNTLARLAGAHLLEEADAANRFRFHDVVREYAAYCRDRDEPVAERTAATLRVLDYYLGSVTLACRTVQRSYNPPPPRPAEPGAGLTTFETPDEARSWFGRERTNITSAVRYAAEHGFPDHAWRLTDPAATFLDRGGSNVESRDLRVVAVHATRVVGDREAEAAMLNGLGMVHMRLGDYGEARRTLESALRLVIEDGPARGQASILHVLGQVALRQGETTEALDLFRSGMAIDQHSGNQEGLCWAHCRIGQALHAIDQHEQALGHLNQAAWIAHQIGETSAEATSLQEMGAIHRELGDFATAATQCRQALAIAESVPDLPATAEICTVLCELNTALHRSGQAILFGRQAVEVCEKTRDLAQHARALEVLGDAQHACGDLVDAVVAWRQAADLYGHTGNTAKAGQLRGKVDAVPVFYQEIVPIAREAHEAADPAPRSWLAEDESTRPLGDS